VTLAATPAVAGVAVGARPAIQMGIDAAVNLPSVASGFRRPPAGYAGALLSACLAARFSFILSTQRSRSGMKVMKRTTPQDRTPI